MKPIRFATIILIMTLILVVALQACSTASAPVAPTPIAPPTSSGSPQATGNVATGTVREVRISAFQFGFDPATITLKKGERVKLTLTSKDVTHGIAIPDFGVSSDAVDSGQSTSVEFTPDKTGTFTFRCNVPCGPGHRDMIGTIIVTE